ncbi:hypothetical protein [Afifella sp. IM 167]|uniref:hypothetical protein n=1 Tax=Afifella sp. IM 167 TaxID=2033586 RepID=UPI001CCD0AC1|nr:hypothetical protein [Afifella sp. IM 167]
MRAELERLRVGATAFRRIEPGQKPSKLLILSMSNAVYNVALEAVLALPFRMRGWQVDVLSSNVYTVAQRGFAAFGEHRLLHYERLLGDPAAPRAAQEEIARRRSGPADFRSVLHWRYRGAWVGPQLLSSVSRSSFDGAPDPRDPAVFEQILQRLGQSVQFVHAAERYLAEHRPDVILVNEPNYHVLGPFVDVAIARGIPIIHYTQPSREDALVFKKLTPETRRIHPSSIAPDLLDRLVEQPWTPGHDKRLSEELESRYSGRWRLQARNQAQNAEQSPEAVRSLLDLDPEKPTAAVFSHVLWDANLFYGEDIFDNYGHWFIETVKAAVANPKVNWLIKLHPANAWKREMSGVTGEFAEERLIRAEIGALPPHVKLLLPDTQVGTLSLFKTIDCGITVRGTIGIELPCFGKPVVTAGTGRYSGLGFTRDHDSAAEYLATLANLHELPPLSAEAERRAKVYAYTLFARRPWVYGSFRSRMEGPITDPLHMRIDLVAKTPEEVHSFGDLDRFADWAASDCGVDYLADDPLAARSCAREEVKYVPNG